MRRIIIAILSISIHSLGIAQHVADISDTVNVTYRVYPIYSYLDSMASPMYSAKLYQESWKIYFDKTLKQLAFESYLEGDTCYMVNYWRSGRIKQRNLFLKDGKYLYFIPEQYCEGGRAICKGYLMNGRCLQIVRYYCNGQKMEEYNTAPLSIISYNEAPDSIAKDTIPHAVIEGKITTWYENGTKRNEMNFINGVQNGECKYWDEKGRIDLTELYKNGRCIKREDFVSYRWYLNIADSIFDAKEYSYARVMYESASREIKDNQYSLSQIKKCQSFLNSQNKK